MYPTFYPKILWSNSINWPLIYMYIPQSTARYLQEATSNDSTSEFVCIFSQFRIRTHLRFLFNSIKLYLVKCVSRPCYEHQPIKWLLLSPANNKPSFKQHFENDFSISPILGKWSKRVILLIKIRMTKFWWKMFKKKFQVGNRRRLQ